MSFRKAMVSVVFLVAFVLHSLGMPGLPDESNSRLALGDHTVKVGDLQFHYVVFGRGPFLVIQSPGWGIGSAYLANGLDRLATENTLLVFDPRGTGGSSPVAASARLTNDDLAADLEHLRAFWGFDSMNLLGHSNGSAIAIVYAERYPQHVHKLILIGSQLLGFKDEPNPVTTAELVRRESSPDFRFYLAHIEDPKPQDDAGFTEYFRQRAGFYLYDPKKDLPALLKTITRAMSASTSRAFIESPPASEVPPLSALSEIAAGTLIIVGRQDPVCPLAESEAIQAGILHSRLIALDKTGHFPWIEQPEKFFPEVMKFLR